MSEWRTGSVLLCVMLALAPVLGGCDGRPGIDSSATPTVSPSASDAGPRFVIQCTGPEGRALGPFTRLEDAWASPNYVRIDGCTAAAATDAPLELSSDEEAIAEIAGRDLPGEEPEQLYLTTLAICVRVTPASTQPLSSLPTSLLEASQALCPQAPHAGLIDDELATRGR